MSWTARPTAALARLAGPIAVSMLSYSTMTLVGTLFVAHLGPASLAGVGLAGIANFGLICFAIGLFSGGKVLIAQAVGARDEAQARAYESTSLVAAAGLTVVLAGVGLGLATILPHLTATSASGLYAQSYLRIRLWGLPAVMLFCAFREGRYARGDSRLPMVASVSGNLVNLALDYLLIVRWKQGVPGAAVAALCGQLTEVMPLGAVYLLRGQRLAGVTWERLRTLLKVGGPTGLQFLLEVGSFATVSITLAGLSDLEMSTHQVVIQVVQFSFLPAIAMGEAVSVLSGQAVGAGRDEWVRGVARRGMWLACLYAVLCSLALVGSNSAIAAAFSDDLEVRSRVERVLWVAAAFQAVDAASIIARSALRGAGDVRFSATVGILCTWILLPPLSWFLGVRMGLGALGGWLGIYAEIVVVTTLYWIRLVSMRWLPVAQKLRARMVADRKEGMTERPLRFALEE